MDYRQLYKKHKKAVQYAICAVFIIIAGIIYLAGRNNMSASEDTFADKDVLIGTEDVNSTEYQPSGIDIYVYICGHVNSPGVVKCQSGMRLYEAVELAGGADDSADMSLVNLAALVNDGQRIYIPSYGEDIPVMEEETAGLININKATAEELMTLPGIGSSRAADIVSYRTDNGRFQTIEDIMKVSGIKEAAFNKIKNYICV
ncbi:MAG: helix-hairpin-helix domain-containing protein [Eubacteriales bacterium]|nr:helix-hairpin-helix domain-containing protein [Eubacteriales bacterium]